MNISQVFGILIVIVIIGVVMVSIIGWDKIAPFTIGTQSENVSFLSKTETANYLLADGDLYISKLTAADLIARGAGSTEAYRRRAAETAADFSVSERIKLIELAKQVNASLQRSCSGFNIPAAKSIPWVFAKTEGVAYEDGLPHTRTNVIFLNDATLNSPKSMLANTLMHEKVHLYQRQYPTETFGFIQTKGFLQWKQRDGEPLLRSNPDLDPYIYIDPKIKRPMGAFYNSERPKNISDVTISPIDEAPFEHPYEMMAYEIVGLNMVQPDKP